VAPPAPTAKTLATLTIVATGDIMMHEAVKDVAASQAERDAKGRSTNHDGFDALFAAVAPELQKADIAFGNMEFPVAPKAGRGTRPFVFNAPAIVPVAVRAAGFRIVSFANNHAFDQGRAGVSETVENIKAAGLEEVGAGKDRATAELPVFEEIHGIRVAFLGFTARFNQNLDSDDPKAPRINPADPDAMRAAIASARKQAELVVVSIHWGTEYAKEPDPGEAELAHSLVDAGAGLILGSHPHVLQALEIYPAEDGRLALIAYSLGNFVSNQSRNYVPGVSPDSQADTRDGALLEITLVKRQYAAGPPRVELGPVTYLPLWTENNNLQRARSKKIPPRIQVVEIDKVMAEAQTGLATALAAKIPDDKAVARLQSRLDFLADQRARIVDRLGGQFQELAPAAPPAPPASTEAPPGKAR
jgi:poly-gamma-glutamate synthesis protein (capsule biosynthesis protein)